MQFGVMHESKYILSTILPPTHLCYTPLLHHLELSSMAASLSNRINFIGAIIRATDVILDGSELATSDYKDTCWTGFSTYPDNVFLERIVSLIEKLDGDWSNNITMAPLVADRIMRDAFKKLVMVAMHEAAALYPTNGWGGKAPLNDPTLMTTYINALNIASGHVSCRMVQRLMQVIEMRDILHSDNAALMLAITNRMEIVVSAQDPMRCDYFVIEDADNITDKLTSMEAAAKAAAMADAAAADWDMSDATDADDAEPYGTVSDAEPVAKRPRVSKEELYERWTGMVVAMIAIALKFEKPVDAMPLCWFSMQTFSKDIEASGASKGPASRNGGDAKIVRDMLMWTKRTRKVSKTGQDTFVNQHYQFDMDAVHRFIDLLPEHVLRLITAATVKYETIDVRTVQTPPLEANELAPRTAHDEAALRRFMKLKLGL